MFRRAKRGHLALDAVLGNEEAARELKALDARRAYLERRAALCRDAIAYADERLEGLRNTYLKGTQAARMPLDEIPEVFREQVRRAREERARKEAENG